MASVCILNLIYLYFFVVYRNIIQLMEGNSIKTRSKTIYGINAVLKLEIWLEELLVERILCLLEAL